MLIPAIKIGKILISSWSGMAMHNLLPLCGQLPYIRYFYIATAFVCIYIQEEFITTTCVMNSAIGLWEHYLTIPLYVHILACSGPP